MSFCSACFGNFLQVGQIRWSGDRVSKVSPQAGQVGVNRRGRKEKPWPVWCTLKLLYAIQKRPGTVLFSSME
jgi:hypothetical protein